MNSLPKELKSLITEFSGLRIEDHDRTHRYDQCEWKEMEKHLEWLWEIMVDNINYKDPEDWDDFYDEYLRGKHEGYYYEQIQVHDSCGILGDYVWDKIGEAEREFGEVFTDLLRRDYGSMVGWEAEYDSDIDSDIDSDLGSSSSE